jgi:hypothetical protein
VDRAVVPADALAKLHLGEAGVSACRTDAIPDRSAAG